MKAIVTTGEDLDWTEVPDIQPRDREIRIENHATGVNRADLVQREGRYPPPPGASPILGLECAGVVDQLGAQAEGFQLGDRVCALLSGGGYAEKVAVPARQILKIPNGMSFVEAASLPEVFATAYLNLFAEADARPGERVLLHAGASGVGTAAIQMCRAFGNPCFVTAGSPKKVSMCCKLGAEAGWDRNLGSFVEAVLEWSEGQGPDVILDPVGAAYLGDNLRVLATGGRIVVIGLLSGATAQVHLGHLMAKRIRIIGSTLRSRPAAEKGRIMSALRERVWPLLESGEIRPVIERVFPIEAADAAHRLLRSNRTTGKLVLEFP